MMNLTHFSKDNESRLRTLALRLLGSPYPGMHQGPGAELMVDTIPRNLPFTFPIPEGANIVGSFICSVSALDGQKGRIE
jgi:hypothetical protein